ncbi:MAG: hypothetical protein QNJ36_03115 [Calothrix sp. MO_167.B42]|nr:hypothetical protein [Calothrix sp. MO_167.B42]
MAKLIHLGSYFLTGCIASSALGWVGLLHPALAAPVGIIYIVLLLLWLLAWITDDAVSAFLKLELKDYYAILIAIAVAVVFGGGASWLVG